MTERWRRQGQGVTTQTRRRTDKHNANPTTTGKWGLHTNIAESHQWKPNPYVRRGPRQGVLFIPKPSTTPLSSYFTTKIATGKRCADDFDCMRVLGQVCKRGKRGSTGNCQCPESTPVHLTDEAQPRCVAGAMTHASR
ncbi:uncharacterized protein [Dermacentor andersoni]|uniref:uncharacterized protein isoform X2 n=1 Tax=Dermacentor andersoni TaxID=34620 RepID=UPI0024177E50|nr:uncharacterized protein LOC126537186 isoform X4 [Dermacentor andersoni]